MHRVTRAVTQMMRRSHTAMALNVAEFINPF